jgi:uncharacterized membrane protein
MIRARNNFSFIAFGAVLLTETQSVVPLPLEAHGFPILPTTNCHQHSLELHLHQTYLWDRVCHLPFNTVLKFYQSVYVLFVSADLCLIKISEKLQHSNHNRALLMQVHP